MKKKTASDSRRLTQILADLMLRHHPTPFKPQNAFRRNTAPVPTCCAVELVGGQKTISCAIAASHLAATMRASLSASLISVWNAWKRKTLMVSVRTCVTGLRAVVTC